MRRGENIAVDESLLMLLVGAGMPKNVAKTLVFLEKNGEATSVEIERGTGMRQPDVSITMKELGMREWVDKRSIKKDGKGRPNYCYNLVKPMNEIIETIEEDAARRIKEIQRNISRLKKGFEP
jgi:predicted transcriptional regulator